MGNVYTVLVIDDEPPICASCVRASLLPVIAS